MLLFPLLLAVCIIREAPPPPPPVAAVAVTGPSVPRGTPRGPKGGAPPPHRASNSGGLSHVVRFSTSL